LGARKAIQLPGKRQSLRITLKAPIHYFRMIQKAVCKKKKKKKKKKKNVVSDAIELRPSARPPLKKHGAATSGEFVDPHGSCAEHF
jgi:hypothetical protein